MCNRRDRDGYPWLARNLIEQVSGVYAIRTHTRRAVVHSLPVERYGLNLVGKGRRRTG